MKTITLTKITKTKVEPVQIPQVLLDRSIMEVVGRILPEEDRDVLGLDNGLCLRVIRRNLVNTLERGEGTLSKAVENVVCDHVRDLCRVDIEDIDHGLMTGVVSVDTVSDKIAIGSRVFYDFYVTEDSSEEVLDALNRMLERYFTVLLDTAKGDEAEADEHREVYYQLPELIRALKWLHGAR